MPNGIVYTDITVEQATEMMQLNPAVFLKSQSQSIQPIVHSQ
jgi:hypothetical protein